LQWRKEYGMELRDKVNRIDNRADEEYVRTFRSFVVDSHFNGPPTPDKIREKFRKYAGELLSENLQKILENHIPDTDFGKTGAQSIKNRNELVRESDQELGRASFLETHLNDVRREFDSLAFPKYIKFGFISLVLYAALGVIFPLTYSIWGKYLLESVDLTFLIPHANNIALLLFGIGLTLTLVYIGLELIHALESKRLGIKRSSETK
jgi:hypothetical protein